jgi:hypothetical protein
MIDAHAIGMDKDHIANLSIVTCASVERFTRLYHM